MRAAGFNVRHHTRAPCVFGLQIEVCRAARSPEQDRQRFAGAFADAVVEFVELHLERCCCEWASAKAEAR
jgi:hypothetical protein